jgi:hypothetical protein
MTTMMMRADGEPVMNEDMELELAAELLSVSNEEELEQFLGDVFKTVTRAVGKVGKAISPALGPLGSVLKGVAKVGLPIAGRMAGTFFGGPVGGAIGGKLGSLVSGAIKEAEGVLDEAVGEELTPQQQEQFLGDIVGGLLGGELEAVPPSDRDLAVARRFVRLASTAAQNVATQPAPRNPTVAAVKAVQSAGHKLGFVPKQPFGMAHAAARNSGRWVRRGNQIVIFGG